MSEPLFISAPFFLVRTPIYPMEECEKILSKENWIDTIFSVYDQSELFRESISIASPSLYASLQKRPLKNPDQAALSLLNYALRMSTRATPFGLFSFISTGSWSTKAKISLDLLKTYKRARPDMEWVYALIQKLYSDESLFLSLPVRLNPLATFSKGRAFLNYIRQPGKIELKTEKALSIHVTKFVASLFALAEERVPIGELLKKLEGNFPQLDWQKATGVIRELLTNQFLLPGLLPSLLTSSPFEDIFPYIPSIEEKIARYNRCPLGEGEHFLSALQKEMGALVEAQTYLQVDAVNDASIFQLPREVSNEIEKAAAFLWKLSAIQPPVLSLKSYHERFLEKYGVHRTVSLLDLLDEEKGLGSYLNSPLAPSVNRPSKIAQQWQNWLASAWQESLYAKKQEIVLDEKLLTHLFHLAEEPLPNPTKAPLSTDVFCKIFADSLEELEKGLFSVLFCQSTWQGSATTGRFLDLLTEEKREEIGDFIRLEESLSKGTLFMELSYFPSSVRSANVAIHPALRSWKLDIEGKKGEAGSLSLEDIYVGASSDRLYLTLSEGKGEIDACAGNLLNLSYAPLPLRFMREVTLAKQTYIHPFSWGKIEELAIFLPRIRFGKTILVPAQWILRSAPFVQQTLEQVTRQFIAWANEWNLPPLFFLARGDQHLLLDRNHPAHLHEIATQLKKGSTLRFIETLPGRNLVQTEAGSHCSQIVVSLLKNQAYAEKPPIFIKKYLPVAYRNRWKLPGSEWVFAKIYLEAEGQDRFLLQHLSLFLEELQKITGPTSWFFLRYRDPDAHLRFRIKLSSSEAFSQTIFLLEKFSINWMETGLIRNIILANYEREIERYGGAALCEIAENLFCADSSASLYLLQAIANKKLLCDESVLHAISGISFLKSFGLEEEDLLRILPNDPANQAGLKGYRNHKKELVSLAKSLDTQPIFYESSRLRSEAAQFFRSQAGGLVPDQLHPIYQSMLHMHYNRLGCNVLNEIRASLYARHTLLQLQYALGAN